MFYFRGVKKDVHISRTVSAAKFIKLGHLLIVVIAGAMRRLKALIMWSHVRPLFLLLFCCLINIPSVCLYCLMLGLKSVNLSAGN